MTREQRIRGSLDARTSDGRRLQVEIDDGRLWIFDGDGRRRRGRSGGRPSELPRFPEGTLRALRPLLYTALIPHGLSTEQAFEASTDPKITMTPRQACASLRRAGIDHVEATVALLDSDPLLKELVAHGHIRQEGVEAIVSEVAGEVRGHYSTRKKRGGF